MKQIKITFLTLIIIISLCYQLYNLELLTINDKSVIPLNIYQTWETYDLPPKMVECVEKLKRSNPEFNYYLYDDNERRSFIKDYFNNDVLNAYDNLIPGAYRADLWRYCILYINGGIYLDIKFCPINDFKFINLTDKEYFVKDFEGSGGGIYNAILICKPNNELLLKCINKIVDNVKEKYYGSGTLSLSGPLLMKEYITSTTPELEVNVIDDNKLCIKLNNNPILTIYEEYREEQKQFHERIKTPHYADLWYNKSVYK